MSASQDPERENSTSSAAARTGRASPRRSQDAASRLKEKGARKWEHEFLRHIERAPTIVYDIVKATLGER